MADLRGKALVVEDDKSSRAILEQRLRALGMEVFTAADGGEGLVAARREAPAVTLLDLQMPRMGGLEVLQALRREGIETTVIVITAHGTVENAVEAMKAGAYDFITKPFDPKHLEIVVRKAVERGQLLDANRMFRDELEARVPPVVGESPAIRAALETARRAAVTNSTVFLLGESGTGKEVFSRLIHQWSPRRERPLVVVNCVALSEQLLESELFGHERGAFTGAHQMKKGKFELADGGTVFLDEVGDLKPGLQTKLLRVLQEREFERVGGTKVLKTDVRIVAATNTDLTRAVKEGQFREDLFYRLNVISITLPPLRERMEDLPALADYFRRKFAAETKKDVEGIEPEALRLLRGYAWPGNVRELANAIERAVVLCAGTRLGPDDILLPAAPEGGAAAAPADSGGFHERVREFKRSLLRDTLRKTGGNQTKAAEHLSLSRPYLVRLMSLLDARGEAGPGGRRAARGGAEREE
jgi:DNA-binding NtrC family response regulator